MNKDGGYMSAEKKSLRLYRDPEDWAANYHTVPVYTKGTGEVT